MKIIKKGLIMNNIHKNLVLNKSNDFVPFTIHVANLT